MRGRGGREGGEGGRDGGEKERRKPCWSLCTTSCSHHFTSPDLPPQVCKDHQRSPEQARRQGQDHPGPEGGTETETERDPAQPTLHHRAEGPPADLRQGEVKTREEIGYANHFFAPNVQESTVIFLYPAEIVVVVVYVVVIVYRYFC